MGLKALQILIFLFVLGNFPKVIIAANDQWESITPSGGHTLNTVAVFGSNIFLGTDNGLYKSIDRGSNWSQVNTGLGVHLDVTSIALGWTYNSGNGTYQLSSSSLVFIGTSDGGVYTSSVDGNSWISTSTGITDSNILDIEIDQSQAVQGSYDHIYVSTPSGIFMSSSTGSYWRSINTGLTGTPSKITSDYGASKIYAITSANKIFSSTLHSSTGSYESWSELFDANSTTTNSISILNPIGTIIWLGTSKGVYKSNGTATTFSTTSVGLPGNAVKSVSSDYINSNIAYAAVYGSGVYRTTNEAIASTSPLVAEWLPINLNLIDLNINEVVSDPSTTTYVYALSSTGLYKLTYSGSAENIDLTPPEAITDLDVAYYDADTISLTWTAPGGDGSYGQSSMYDLRYSTTSAINTSNFAAATQVTPQPTPYAKGNAETYYIHDINYSYPYYFAIKSSDGPFGGPANNTSELSNVANMASSTIGGTVSGLNGGTLQIRDSYGSTKSITNNGAYTFSDTFYDGQAYSVSITSHPTGYYCTISNSSGTMAASSVSNINISCAADNTRPVVSFFDVAATSSSLTVTIDTFSGSDNNEISGYMITESPGAPNPADTGWTGTAWESYTFVSEGSKTLYSWIIDKSGNISLSVIANITVTLPSTPVVPSGGSTTGSSSGSSGGGGGGGGTNYSISVIKSGPGSIVSNYFGINCGASCFYNYPSNVTVVLTGTPSSGYHLAAWKGCTELSGSSCRVFMNANKVISAEFAIGTSSSTPINIQVAANSPAVISGTSLLSPIPSAYLTLTLGSKGPLVMELQKFLNSHGSKVAGSGAGSPGHETQTFGVLTEAALKKYILMLSSQGSASTMPNVNTAVYPYFNSIYYIGMTGKDVSALQSYLAGQYYMPKDKITGYYGPITDAAFKKYKSDVSLKMLSVTSSFCPPGLVCIPIQSGSSTLNATYVFGRELWQGTKNSDVKKLQQFLNRSGFILAAYGAGSPGNETEFFGAITKAALIKFQTVNLSKIAYPNGPSGYLDSYTIKYINSLRP